MVLCKCDYLIFYLFLYSIFFLKNHCNVVAIDFSEEDLPASILEGNDQKITKISEEILNKLDDSKVGEIMREGFKIAIFGPPNSGKSSF